MARPLLLLIQPSQDVDRLGSRRRRKSSIPKLNLPLLAAHAEDRFDVRIVDETIDDIDFDAPASLVGITVLTQHSQRAYAIAAGFRNRGVKVVLGGVHVTFYPDEAAEHADALVVGEAERVWTVLLDDFLAGDLKLRYKAEQSHSLVGLPRPRLDLLNRSAYTFTNIIETARGCPHRCTYCAVTRLWGNKFRFRPVGEVIDEIRTMPPGPLMFIDDNIVGSSRRAKELFSAMIPLGRRWYGQGDIRVAKDPELLELAARSGCKWLFMGIESINAENIASVGKSRVNAVGDYAESIAAIHAAGISVFGSFIFGFDQDDTSVFERTVEFCIQNRLRGANFYILTPMPFTELFDEMDAQGRILHRDWSRYDMNHVVFQPKNMTPEQLLNGYIGAYRTLYSLPSISRRILRPHRNLPEFLALNVGRMLNAGHFEEGCRY